MKEQEWATLLHEELALLPITEAERAEAFGDLFSVPSEAGMRPIDPQRIARRLAELTNPQTAQTYLSLRERMEPFNRFGFSPIREVAFANVWEAVMLSPQTPLLQAATTRMRRFIPAILDQPHFQVPVKDAEGDIREFFVSLTAMTRGLIFNHGEVAISRVNADGTRLRISHQACFWGACKYLLPGFYLGILDFFEVKGDVSFEVQSATDFNALIEMDARAPAEPPTEAKEVL